MPPAGRPQREQSIGMTADSAEAFVRPPLEDPGKQIRLLRLSRDEFRLAYSDDIHCILTTHVLEDVITQYAAVSYTWGPSTPTETIYVNGQIFEVRYNCWYALWQLRLHGVQGWVWIDAICIDQGSHHEKNQQIMQMGEIYAHAESVAACLGPSGDDEKLFIRNLAVPSNHVAFFRKAADYFSRRSYFDRLWVVQECFLAAKLEAYCGPHRIDWHTLLDTACLGAVPEQVRTYMVDRRAHLNAEGGTVYPYDFAVTVIKYCDRACHDLHDKLYGLLALAPEEVRLRIPVDYGTPLVDLLIKYAAIYVILDTDQMTRMIHSIRLLAHEFAQSDQEFLTGFHAFLEQKLRGSKNPVPAMQSKSRNDCRSTTVQLQVHVANMIMISDLTCTKPDTAEVMLPELSAEPCDSCGICHGPVEPGHSSDAVCPDCIRPVASIAPNMKVPIPDALEESRPRTAEPRLGSCLLWQGSKAMYRVPPHTQKSDILATIDVNSSLDHRFEQTTLGMVCRKTGKHGVYQILGNTSYTADWAPHRSSSGGLVGEIEVRAETLVAVVMVTQTNAQFLKKLVAMGGSWLKVMPPIETICHLREDG